MRDSDTHDTDDEKDILIPVRESEANEQLRYCLRSLKNLPHGRVFIAGYKPRWVKNVVYIKLDQHIGSRFEKAARNVYEACMSGISNDFYLFMDDVYITRPIKDIPTHHRGDIQDVLDGYGSRHSTYLMVMRQTLEALRMHGLGTLSYEMHAPMIMNKHRFIETYEFMLSNNIPHGSTRSVYGNMHKIGGTKSADVKVYNYRESLPDTPFFSTNHSGFPLIKTMYLEKMFPEKSKFEL